MKKILTALCLLGAGALCAFLFRAELADAAGHIGFRNVEPELRSPPYTIVFAGRSATEVTEGTNGVVEVLELNGLSEADITGTDPDMLPYPCKLDVEFVDPTNDSTLECDCVQIWGRNQFGVPITDTVGTCATDGAMDESGDPYETAKVFEIITKVTADDCAGATAAEDDLRLSCSGEVGLPMPVESEAAILRFCIYDLSATNTLCFESGDITTDLGNESVETDGLIGGGSTALADGDVLQITVRPPAGL